MLGLLTYIDFPFLNICIQFPPAPSSCMFIRLFQNYKVVEYEVSTSILTLIVLRIGNKKFFYSLCLRSIIVGMQYFRASGKMRQKIVRCDKKQEITL